MSHEESRDVLPIQCQLQKVINALHRFRHNVNKSALALEIWENTNKKNKIKEETVELIEIELNSIIKLASTAKAESSTPHSKVRELQSKVAHLEEELKDKSKQCENLQQQVDELNFKDIDAEMISEPKRQLESETDEKNSQDF